MKRAADPRDAGARTPILIAAWYLWIPVAWVFPVVLLLIRLEYGGWDALLTLVTAPITIPIAALLALLPRFLLRRAGWRHAPASLVSLLICAGWGLLAIIVTWRGTGDSGPMEAALPQMLGWVSPRAEAIIRVAGVLLFAVGVIGAVIVTARLVPLAEVEVAPATAEGAVAQAPAANFRIPDVAGGNWPRRRLIARDLLPLFVLVLVPVLLTGIAWSGSLLQLVGTKDDDGNTEADVALLSDAGLTAQQEQYWDDVQEEAKPLRERLAPAGWQLGEASGIVDLDQGGAYAYEVRAHWQMLRDGSPESVADQARSAAEALGWSSHGGRGPDGAALEAETRRVDESGVVVFASYRFTNEAGYRLLVSAAVPAVDPHRDGEAIGRSELNVIVTDGPFWTGNRVFAWNGPEDGDPKGAEQLQGLDPRTFGSDEWPGLVAVQEATVGGFVG